MDLTGEPKRILSPEEEFDPGVGVSGEFQVTGKLPLGFQGRILADIGASDGRRLHPAGYCFQERGFPAAVFTDKEGQRVCEIQTFQGSDTGNVEGKPCREFLFVQADRAQIDQRSSLFSWKSSSTKIGVSYREKSLIMKKQGLRFQPGIA